MIRFIEFIKEAQSEMRWAIGDESWRQRIKNHTGESLVWLNPEKVMRAGDNLALDPDSTTGGENGNPNRIERLKDYISDPDNYLDPPLIGFNQYSRKVSFTDGRHRTFLAHKLGLKKIPFYVPTKQKMFFLANFR